MNQLPPDSITTLFYELRHRLLVVAAFFSLGAVLGLLYHTRIIKWIAGLVSLQTITITSSSPYQFIDIAFQSALCIGLLFAMPIVLIQIIQFFRPALKPAEYRLTVRIAPLSLLLAAMGFGFGIYLMQFVLRAYSGWEIGLPVYKLWDMQQFLGNLLLTGLALALVFQLPVILTALLKIGLINRSILTGNRRNAYAALLLLALFLPPTDPLSLVLCILPLCLLFEFTLLLERIV